MKPYKGFLAPSILVFSITKFCTTSISSPLKLKVRNESSAVETMGSPLRLKEVFKMIGHHVAFSNVSINL